ncbi:hypothetical protein EFP20_29660 (plasmid) [Burkholderia glumae]|nr:hypothetical protein CEQ24_011675 [Burkholderia glumae]UVS88370.1 hypothetical protein EFP17_00255 [Burkholderia glumae]UVT05740.1 hypothetical protein EFP20_29660 [Burkholderia glumae]
MGPVSSRSRIRSATAPLQLLGDKARGIVSFEQASAIAVSMTDYVLELMRTGPAADDDARAS